MHELSVTQSIVDAVLHAVPDGEIKGVHLEIGKLSGVVPDAVRFCFEIVAADSRLQGADLEITEPSGRGRCRSCGAEFEIDDFIVLCSCGSADVAVLSGQELRIKAVEVV
ncbi:hydrogenase maturation nickel metallochaperone HypA/HybF [Saccharopolyspora rectivirgula]|jgi:hydrogenase nickel incorporation protein HypA/HybF|uniref:Hydrogenase maturation factor HypA n=1 Tax=Saccharopolyspora rectivirgula TaxID=28042 RepID=A0A073B038_9PSEU|nr:hydrogenase maturation nickel metallochaperone HypA [Saccharopolyspora rectivirgula]KEI45000.1 hydrogenase nickel incorporation protein HypA [Saccharopolyspora rectivirgula]